MLISFPLLPFGRWRQRNKRGFEAVEDDSDRVKDRWLPTIGFLIMGHLKILGILYIF